MRSSLAVSLLLASSASIFGVYEHHHQRAGLPPGPEPVWVNGVMGVYHPITGEFVPADSPDYEAVCDLIRQQRQQSQNSSVWIHSSGSRWHYWHTHPSHTFVSGRGPGNRSSNPGGGVHSGSIRGGIGATGHAHGGGAHS